MADQTTTTQKSVAHHAGRDETLRSTLWSVSALLLSVAILLMGNGLQSTLVPVRGNLEQFLAFEIGVLGAAYFVGFTLGCYFGPGLIGHAGHIRTYLAMVSVASVVALAHALVVEPVTWWLLRIATGFCLAVLYIVIESWLNEQSTNATRGTVFSIYTAINLTVISVGQMMLALDDPKSFALFSLSSILLSLAAVPIAFSSAITPQPIPWVRPRIAKLFRTSPVGVAGCVAVGLSNGAFWALGPVFAQDRGLDTLGIGLFMSAAVLGGAVVQWPLGWLSDHTDRRRVMLLSALIALAAGLALMLELVSSMMGMLALATAFGVGAFPVYSIAVAHANDHADPSDAVEVSSGLLLAFGVGASIGPMVAGLLRQAYPGPTLFYFTASMHLLLILFVLWRMAQREAPPSEERVDFSDAIIAAKTVGPIDPLAESVEAGEDDGPDASQGRGTSELAPP